MLQGQMDAELNLEKKFRILVKKLEKWWTTLTLEKKKTVKTEGDEESLENNKYQELV